MRKKYFGRQLQRDTNERKALFKSLMEALVLRESIQTTEAKAKAIKGHVEKMVTKAKHGGVTAERSLQQYFAPSVLKKLLTDVAPRFKNRPGGYTRIIKLGSRFSDNAQMVVLEWVVKPVAEAGRKKEEVKGNKSVVMSEAKESDSEKVEATAKVEKKKGTKETKEKKETKAESKGKKK